MVNELNRLAGEEIAASELTPRKAVLIGNFSRELETTDGLVNQIAHLALYGLNLNEINSYIQNVQNISDAQARQFVQNMFGNSKTNVIIVGDAAKFLPDLKKHFPSVQIEVIPAGELDLNNPRLRKTASQSKR